MQTDLLGTRETMALKIAVSREIATGDELERDANMCTRDLLRLLVYVHVLVHTHVRIPL